MSDVTIDISSSAPRPADAPEARAQRVGACALGLAYAGRQDEDGLAELVDMADRSRAALEHAVDRLPGLGVVEEAVAAHARRLLRRAAGRLPATPSADGRDDATGSRTDVTA